MRSPFSVVAVTSLGITVYPHLTPVKPAVLEKLLNSIATFSSFYFVDGVRNIRILYVSLIG